MQRRDERASLVLVNTALGPVDCGCILEYMAPMMIALVQCSFRPPCVEWRVNATNTTLYLVSSACQYHVGGLEQFGSVFVALYSDVYRRTAAEYAG